MIPGITTSKPKPRFYKSLVTGNEYCYDTYLNHGYGGVKFYRKRGEQVAKPYIDLPKEEYPFTFVYQEKIPPLYVVLQEKKWLQKDYRHKEELENHVTKWKKIWEETADKFIQKTVKN